MNIKLLGKRIISDALGLHSPPVSPLDDHLGAAIDWLCAAQDSQANGGVSLRYSLITGWDASYPETTGYIIPTFFDYSVLTGRDEFSERAIRMADWEISIQNRDGSFNGGAYGSGYGPFVFDTGQILFGLIAAHKKTQRDKYIDAAMRAGKWLISVQEAEGAWKNYTFHTIPHTYYTRVAWALAQLGQHTNEASFAKAAARNIDWAITKRLPNGWFDGAGFTTSNHSAPYTHTISYALEGILGTGLCLGRDDYIDIVLHSADALLQVVRDDGFCHGMFDHHWASAANFSCLTGSAQFAVVFFRAYGISGNERFLKAARSLNHFLKQHQEMDPIREIHGAISGSYPIWGRYQRFAYPNWAAKFFADSLLLERSYDIEERVI